MIFIKLLLGRRDRIPVIFYKFDHARLIKLFLALNRSKLTYHQTTISIYGRLPTDTTLATRTTLSICRLSL